MRKEYTVDSNATQAAIRAGYSAHTAEQQGSRLCRNVQVAAAIQDMQAEHRERMAVSKESVMAQLNDAYDMAKKIGQTAVMVQATMGIAKVHDLLVDRTEDVSKPSDMTPDERAAELERVQAELDAIEKTKH